MTESITVRQLKPEEWALYKELRLRALQADPLAFGSSHAREEGYADSEWQQRLSRPDGAVFGVFLEGAPVGMTGIAVKKDEPGKARLWGTWLEKALRGQGLSRRLYAARLEWARARQGISCIEISHWKSNPVSGKAALGSGFVFTHEEEALSSSGRREPQLFYELRLS